MSRVAKLDATGKEGLVQWVWVTVRSNLGPTPFNDWQRLTDDRGRDSDDSLSLSRGASAKRRDSLKDLPHLIG
jgi:hypothetical protein